MSYLVFARKYRPQTLSELIGQDHVSTTLRNALRENRVAQSFLFSGTRGVGKTSAARILAKMLNCEKAKPGEDPCQQCSSCTEVTRGSSLDVLEIDGASNRGIDEVRTLRENVKFKPMVGTCKVYIIDEVHMLTGEAFNALLKTLEEPPEHVKFVFATTEVHKVPLTILSRCQRYHFRRIPTGEIVKTLEQVAKEESIRADRETLFVIAKQAEGSLRDAESLLEQMVSFSGKQLKREEVEQALGLSPQTFLFQFVDAIATKNGSLVLELLGELVARGEDLAYFVSGLLETFRALLLAQVLEKPEKFLEMSEEGEALVAQHKGQFSREELFMILDSLQELNWKVRRSNAPRILAEVSLLELAGRESMESLASLVKELKAGREGARESIKKNFESEPAKVKQPAVTAAAQAPVPPKLDVPAKINIPQVEVCWPEIVETVKARKMSAGSFLAESVPVEVTAEGLIIGFPVEFRFHKQALEKKENLEIVEAAVAEKLGTSIPVRFAILQGEGAGMAAPASRPEEKVPDIVSQAVNLFEGKIIRRD